MASDSDAEEFYDAYDTTPNTANRSVIKYPVSSLSVDATSAALDYSSISSLPIVSKGLQIPSHQFASQTVAHVQASPNLQHSFLRPLTPLQTSRELNRDYEETGSSCSGSLLGNLADDDDDEEITKRIRSGDRRRRKHHQVRHQIDKDDDEPTLLPHSPAGSQSSSLDGIYLPSKTSHPFRVVEHDTASVYSSVSLGKVGRILGGIEFTEALTSRETQLGTELQIKEDIFEIGKESLKRIDIGDTDIIAGDFVMVAMSPEPDLVASTKSSSGSDKSNSLPRNDADSYVPQSSLREPVAEECREPANPVEFSSHAVPHVIHSTPLPTSYDFVPIVGFAASTHPQCPLNPTNPVMSLSHIQPSPVPVPTAPPRRRRRKQTDDDNVSLGSVSSLPSAALTFSNSDVISIGHSLDLRQVLRGDYLVKPQDSENSKAIGPTAEEIARQLLEEDTYSQASTPEVSRAPSRLANIGGYQSQTASTPGSPSSTTCATPTAGNMLVPALIQDSESSLNQLNLMVRTRSDSGKELSEMEWYLQSPVDFDVFMANKEILEQVTVLNLDTGERIPLSEAEDRLPPALNPLSLHLMRITNEYVGSSNDQGQESDEESIADIGVKKPAVEIDGSAVKKKTSQLKKFLGRKMESTVKKASLLAKQVSHHRHREEKDVFEDDAPAHDTMQYVKIKTAHSHKGPHEFDNLMYVQEIIGEHTGPIWCMKFSGCGRLLATAGQDHVLRVWVLKQAFTYFLDIRTKCNADIKVSPTPSQESLVSQHSGQSGEDMGSLDPDDDGSAPFMPKPFCVYTGHTADMLDVSWSKNYFILTSSMDKTVRLWHISRKECLCIFQHMDFVTAIAFHPKDDRYFISGALDGKLRLWSIPDKRVVLWNEAGNQPTLITAANFCQNGKFTVVGTYDGRCIFYETEQLKYFTQISVRSTRGKNAKGRKITGIEPLPGEDKILITSNDSRIRLYDLRDLALSCKYKGYSNVSSQIRAGFSHDGKFIVAGSENQCIYIWKTHHDYSKFSSARRDRNIYWEGVKAHNAVVTSAVFSPHPELVFNFIEQKQERKGDQVPAASQQKQQNSNQDSNTTNKGYVLVSADFNGCMKIFLKKEKPKHSSLPASALV